MKIALRQDGAPFFGWVLFILIAGGAITLIDLHLIHQRGLFSELTSTLALAEQAIRENTLPRTAFYPPLVMLLILGLRYLGVDAVNPWVFNLSLLALGLAAVWILAAFLLKETRDAFIVVLLALLNPYFVWTLLLSRDASAELLFLSLTLLLAVISRRAAENAAPRTKNLLGFGVLGGGMLLSLTRVTGFFVAFTLFLLALGQSQRRQERRFWLFILAAFGVFTLAFCAYNYLRVGSFTLATNGGYNLYLGNHPAYLHAHPHYDVDVFLARPAGAEHFESLSEAERDKAYTRKALRFIADDPPAFLYRLLVKSIWHWFNLEKIPNYTTLSFMEDRALIVHLAPIDVLPGLAYFLYKLAYLPLFIYSVILIFRRNIDRLYALLYAPLLGLWPVVALTFPDTRFKINAEILALPAMVAAWKLFIQSRKENANKTIGYQENFQTRKV